MGNLTHTVSGDIASFRSAARVPIESLKCHFKPKQDLHGYSKPWPGGGGKNIFNWSVQERDPDDTTNRADVSRIFTPYTYSVGFAYSNYFNPSKITNYSISNGTISLTVSSAGYGLGFAIPVTAETAYVVSATLTDAAAIYASYFAADGSYLGSHNNIMTESRGGKITTVANASIMVLVLTTGSGGSGTFTNIQVETGTTATSYEPYENICPIEGWNQCEIHQKGKNLVNITESNIIYKNLPHNNSYYTLTDGKITLNVVTASSYMLAFPALEITTQLVGKQVILSARTVGNGDYGIFLSDLNGNNRTSNKANPYTITTNDIGKLLGVRIRVNGFISTYIVDNIQLEFGSVATNYEPYQEQNIPITFPTTGKNKFNSNSVTNLSFLSYDNNTNSFINTAEDTRTTLEIYCEGWISTTERVAALFSRYQVPTGTFTQTFTVTNSSFKNMNYLRLKHNGSKKDFSFFIPLKLVVGQTYTLSMDITGADPTTIGGVSFKNIQIELGDTATEYEPYSSDNTVYGGYVDIAKGEIVATHKQKILNGTEGWSTYKGTSQPGHHFVLALTDKKIGLNGTISDTFPNVNNIYFWDRDNLPSQFGDHYSNYNLYFNAPYAMTNGVSEWKTWLSEHNVTIVYPLVTSIHYPISKTELKTFLDQNNIWSNTNDITEVSYQIHDSNMIKEVKNIMVAANNSHYKKIIWNQWLQPLTEDNWWAYTPDNNTITYSNGIATSEWIGPKTGYSGAIKNKVGTLQESGQVWYGSYMVKSSIQKSWGIELCGGQQIRSIVTPSADTWGLCSAVTTYRAGTRNYIYICNLSSVAGNDQIGTIAQVKAPIHINLTQMFGAGNEPTKAEFEHLCSLNNIDLTTYHPYDEGTEQYWIFP